MENRTPDFLVAVYAKIIKVIHKNGSVDYGVVANAPQVLTQYFPDERKRIHPLLDMVSVEAKRRHQDLSYRIDNNLLEQKDDTADRIFTIDCNFHGCDLCKVPRNHWQPTNQNEKPDPNFIN